MTRWVMQLALIANAIDWIETVVGVGWLRMHELVPMSGWWIAHGGLAGWTIWKAIVAVGLWGIWRGAALARVRWPRESWPITAGEMTLLSAATILLWLAVVSNVLMLINTGMR